MKIVIDTDSCFDAVFNRKYSPICLWFILTAFFGGSFAIAYITMPYVPAVSIFEAFFTFTLISISSFLGLVGLIIGHNLKAPYQGLFLGYVVGAAMVVIFLLLLVTNPFGVILSLA